MRAALDLVIADAEALAASLGRLPAPAGQASASHPGSAGRKRAGAGESFWQYRRYQQEDGAERIDWRRSAQGEKLFVRETELETARSFLFWVDPSAGFHWRSSEDTPAKATRAAVIFTALSSVLARAGERIGGLDGIRAPSTGGGAAQRLAEDMWGLSEDTAFPTPGRERGTVLLASDFYTPIDTWRERLGMLAETFERGALLAVADPVEASWPFSGRTRFSRPGHSGTRLVGRAETIRADYLERFARQRSALKELTDQLGWVLVTHTTDQDPRTPLAELASYTVDEQAT